MKLDIHAAVVTAVIVSALGALLAIWAGVRTIRAAQKVTYYRLARQRSLAGWWTIIFAIMLVGLAFLLGIFAEPVAYQYFPPSPTLSLTPTISLSPTISLTPTITETPTISLTPAESYTPTVSLTPFVPITVETQFTSSVTPDPAVVFSPLAFSRTIQNYEPVDPQTNFQNPIGRLFATYTYDHMTDGVQWTALWYRDGELLSYETSPWEGGTGGSGEYKLELPAEQWLPGTYQLVFFVGMEWIVSGEFQVYGEPPTATPTLTPSPTLSATATQSLTATK